MKAKLTHFQKKKLGLSLRKKKNNFWVKNWKKNFENNVQKLANFKEKKGLFGPKKNKLGLSLRTKKGLFWVKIVKKIEFKYVKNLSEIAKMKQNKSNHGPKRAKNFSKWAQSNYL